MDLVGGSAAGTLSSKGGEAGGGSSTCPVRGPSLAAVGKPRAPHLAMARAGAGRWRGGVVYGRPTA